MYIISIFTNSYTSLRTGTSDLKGQETFPVREHSFADVVKICLVKTIFYFLVEEGIAPTSSVSLAKATKYTKTNFPMVRFRKFCKNVGKKPQNLNKNHL